MLNVKLTITNGYGLPVKVHKSILLPEDPDEAKNYIDQYIDEYIAEIVLNRPQEIMYVDTWDFANSVDFIIEMMPQEEEKDGF